MKTSHSGLLAVGAALFNVLGFATQSSAQVISGVPGAPTIDNVVYRNGPRFWVNPTSYTITYAGAIPAPTILAGAPAGLFTGITYTTSSDPLYPDLRYATISIQQPSNSGLIVWGVTKYAPDLCVGPNLMLFTPAPAFSVRRGDDFVIGYATIFNGTILTIFPTESFRLGIESGVTDPLFTGINYQTVGIEMTTNYNIDPWADADSYTFSGLPGTKLQLLEGQWGSIEVLGRFKSPLTITGFGNAVDLSFGANGEVGVSPAEVQTIRVFAVPEPSTYAALGGLCLLAAVCFRVRKK